jgi:hypothetical protein
VLQLDKLMEGSVRGRLDGSSGIGGAQDSHVTARKTFKFVLNLSHTRTILLPPSGRFLLRCSSDEFPI